MAKIFIDGRFVGVGDSIARYTLELLEGILAIDHTNSYTLLVRPVGEKQASTKLKQFKNLKIDVLDIPHYSLAEQRALKSYLIKENFDLAHFTQFNHPISYRGKFIVSIHDLTMIGHLHRKNIIEKVAFGAVLKSAVKNSQTILASSNSTKDDILDFYKVDQKKIKVVHLGLDHNRFNNNLIDKEANINKFREKYHLNNYFLYTGMWKRHKNLKRMLAAYEKCLSECLKGNKDEYVIQLALVGKIDRNEPEILQEAKRINEITKKQFNQEGVILTGFIEEEELPYAYAGAEAYIMPSLSEGFGWPPLEAMACGTPVLSSKESCMPEVLGQAPLYFDPYNIKDIAGAMSLLLSNERLKDELREKGLTQVQKYNWQKCAEKTYAQYLEILKN